MPKPSKAAVPTANPPARKVAPEKNKSLESWIWDAACPIRGAQDAPKYNDFILPLIFTKRLCDVFDDELNRIAAEVGSRKKAFQLAKRDHKPVRFFLPLEPADPEQPVWSVIWNVFQTLESKLAQHSAKANQFRDLFRTLLHELMTAKLRVTSINLE